MKVLVADDDLLIRTMVADLLADLGHAVIAASDGAEAVELARREAPDLLVLDLLMPRLSGLDALAMLRGEGLATPAVLLTAISEQTLRGLDGAEAAAAILEKPVTRRRLERALARASRAPRVEA